MTISPKALIVAAYLSLVVWLLTLTVVLVVLHLKDNDPSEPVSPTPTVEVNPDGTTYEQAPDLSGTCITYDGDYSNDTCPD